MQWPLLDNVSDEVRSSVLRAATRRRYRRGETLFHEGDRGDTLHLLASGYVAIRVSNPDGDVATLNVLSPGSCIGELALVTALDRRSATAVALVDVETLALHRRDFDDLCRREPRVERFIVNLLAARVRELSARLLDVSHLSAEKRVCRRLHELLPVFGVDGVVTVPMTQEELATIAGTTRPTANRVLRDLVEQGVLRLGRGRIEVLDRDRLALAAS